jgi:RNA polymerase sigma factor (TIGR02999 family)
LRRIARRQIRGERAGQTLNTTALVHETYLKLFPESKNFADRAHFFAVAARVMRHILVDHARARLAGKRGGGARVLSIEDSPLLAADSTADILELDEALSRLRLFSPRQEQIVELRFFSGMAESEVAAYLGLSARTVRRDWNLARAWLYGELRK